MSGTWIPGEGWMVFGRQPQMPDMPEYVPQHDPKEPVNSPYYIKPPVVEVVAGIVPVPVIAPTPGAKAEALLREVLAVDPVPATEVQRLAANASIAARTLRRARERMKVRVFKRAGQWWWELPDSEHGRP
jgi:hypothetical protein